MTVVCTTPSTLRLELLNAAGTVTNTLDLMDAANGYRVQTLDIGLPTVRQISAALPTRDGDYDVTHLYGPRTVTITGSFVPSSAGTRQDALAALSWWLSPRLRPRLVYAIDVGETVLWLGLRGSALTAVHSNPTVSTFNVSWVAPDPIARALAASQITINPGATGTALNHGTYRAWPILDFYGPCTNPALLWTSPAGGQVVFTALSVPSGQYLEVDCKSQTVLLNADVTQSRYQYLDFSNTRWAGFESGSTTVQFYVSSSSAPARVVVTWADSTI
jgi:hypothetical protein